MKRWWFAWVVLAVARTGRTPAGAARLAAIEVHDPARLAPLASRDLPGRLLGARFDGDRLRVVIDDVCADCAGDRWRVSALAIDLSDPRALRGADALRFEARRDSGVRFSPTRIFHVEDARSGSGGRAASSPTCSGATSTCRSCTARSCRASTSTSC
jgi:hypothetical protein